MKRGVGLDPGHIVLDDHGDPAPLPQRGTASSLIFGPCLLRPNTTLPFGMEVGLGLHDIRRVGRVDPSPQGLHSPYIVGDTTRPRHITYVLV